MIVATLATLAAEGAEKVINPVVPDIVGEIFWGAVSFFTLWVLMRYALLPPLLRVRAQRAEQEQGDLEAAAAAEAQAEQVRRDYEATLAEARSQAHQVLEEARAHAEAERGRKVSAVESEVLAERQASMAELDSARAVAVGQMGSDVAELAVAAASKVVDAPLSTEANRATVESYMEDLR